MSLWHPPLPCIYDLRGLRLVAWPRWCCLGSGDLIIYVLNNIWEFDKCRIDSLDEHFDMQDDVWMEWYLLWVNGEWYDQGASFAPKFSMFGAGLLARAKKKRSVVLLAARKGWRRKRRTQACCKQHDTSLFFSRAELLFSLLLFPLFFLSPLFFFFLSPPLPSLFSFPSLFFFFMFLCP